MANKLASFLNRQPEVLGFAGSLAAVRAKGRVAVIPDIKCVSPKEGDLLQGRDPVEVAVQLVQWGVPVLSVVTARENFGGSPELLTRIAEKTSVPVLRKDFISKLSDLEESVQMGATAVLLIAASVDEATLAKLYGQASFLGLEPFVEVCSPKEMAFAATLKPDLLGINNRDIMTLEMDSGGAGRTQDLAAGAPEDALLISESGILTSHDARLAARAGADAILVGTALWQADDMEAKYRELERAASSA